MNGHHLQPVPSEKPRPVLSIEALRVLIKAVTPRPARLLPSAARGELTRMMLRRWQHQASCATADPVAWYPAQGSIPPAQVMRICAACPVRRSCLAAALLWNEDGIWAGTNPGHRRKGYRLMAAGIPTSAVVELLLARPDPHGDMGTVVQPARPVAESQHRPQAA